MKKSLLLFLSVTLLSTTVYSQKKNLTIQEAVLKGRTTLAPKRLQNLGFIPDSKKIAYIDKNELIVVNSADGKILSSMSTVAFNKELAAGQLDTIASYQGIKWKNENQFYFLGKNGELLYSV